MLCANSVIGYLSRKQWNTSKLHTLRIAKQYREDGFCFPLQFFSAEQICQEFYPRYKDFHSECLQKKKWSEYRFKSHLLLPWLNEMLVNNDALKNLAQELLGSDVVIWSTDWCVKPKCSQHHFTWHQDSTYSKFLEDGVTVWLAFSHVRASSGPLLFRKSSHLLGQLPHVESEDESNLLAFGQYIPEDTGDRNESDWNSLEVVTAELQPGQASAHSFLTIHSSSPNKDLEDRVGLAVRLVRTSAGLHRHDRVTHLCGNKFDEFNFEREETPQTTFGQKELAEWRKSMDREKSLYFADRETSSYK